MITSTFAARAGVLMTSLALAGCYHGPSKLETDEYAHKLIVKTENDQSLVGQYHTMITEDDKHLGVIYINKVTENQDTGITCINYNAWKYENSESNASGWRQYCLSSWLKPN